MVGRPRLRTRGLSVCSIPCFRKVGADSRRLLRLYVASGVSRIIIFRGRELERMAGFQARVYALARSPVFGKLEPTHVGCYDFYVASGVSRIIIFRGRELERMAGVSSTGLCVGSIPCFWKVGAD